MPIANVGLAAGAVATSTTLLRRWTDADGVQQHHLIDPVTGLPSASDLVQASAIAAEGWVAEVMAKAVLLRGSARAFDLVDGTGIEAMTVRADGTILQSSGFGRFVGDGVLPDRIGAPA
jgi:thiamine biosynthesis lipoprotein